MTGQTHQPAPGVQKAALAPAPAGLAQHPCGCNEVEKIPQKRRLGQTRLTVSLPGDRWEQEADRLAESALGGQKPTVQPGQAPALMRSPSPASGGQVPSALGSQGRPLEAGTRTFMEKRFSYDFGQVRVHTDRGAARSAAALGARAYTVGQEVVFAEGQYAPGTPSGQKLLAHELAHTLQQESDMPVVRRQAADLGVRGLPDGRAAEPDFVYFNIARPLPADVPPESALDSGERTKAENKAHQALAANDQEMSLYGFASEEGGAAYNTPLVERRMTAVENVLVHEGFAPPRTIHRNARLACSSDKYDYRSWRVVEMQRGTAASTRTCTPSSAQPGACATDTASNVMKVRDNALELINGPKGALARLDHYIQNQASEPDVQTALDHYFGNSHTVQTAQAVRDRVDAIRAFLQAMGPNGSVIFQCGTMDEPSCHTGSPANASHRLQRVTICPTFFNEPKYADRREEILIHEASHGSRIPTDDRAYQRERVILILNTQQALANAQSLTDFILEMNGKARPLGPEHPDTVSNCDPAGGNTHERLVREAIAWAERWNTYAMYGTAQTYGSATNRAAMAPYISAHFGRSDQAAIAGLYDRYRVMSDWFDRFYTICCVPATDPSCTGTRTVRWTLTTPATAAGGGPQPNPPAAVTGANTGATSQPAQSGSTSSSSAAPSSTPAASATPAGDIAVCPNFFNLSTLYDRVVEMYSGLAVNIPGITEGNSRSYARLAYNYKTEFWGVP